MTKELMDLGSLFSLLGKKDAQENIVAEVVQEANIGIIKRGKIYLLEQDLPHPLLLQALTVPEDHILLLHQKAEFIFIISIIRKRKEKKEIRINRKRNLRKTIAISNNERLIKIKI